MRTEKEGKEERKKETENNKERTGEYEINSEKGKNVKQEKRERMRNDKILKNKHYRQKRRRGNATDER